MTPRYTITAARREDLTRLAAIELAAARLLAGHAPESVLNEITSVEVLEKAQRAGHLWVVLADDLPVAFAHAELIEQDAVHLEEIALRSFSRHIVSKPQASMSAWATRGSTPSRGGRRATPTSSTSRLFSLHLTPRAPEPTR